MTVVSPRVAWERFTGLEIPQARTSLARLWARQPLLEPAGS